MLELPDSFPAGTTFQDVDRVPVTWQPDDDRCFAWDEADAESPRWFSLETMARRGRSIPEAEFRALCEANWTRASPARLLAAAKDYEQRLQAHRAELKANGLTDEQIAKVYAANATEHRAREAERLAVRAIGTAKRSGNRS